MVNVRKMVLLLQVLVNMISRNLPSFYYYVFACWELRKGYKLLYLFILYNYMYLDYKLLTYIIIKISKLYMRVV